MARVLALVDADAADRWASLLLDEFGSTAGLMAQPAEALHRASGSDAVAVALLSVGEFTRQWLKRRMSAGPVLAHEGAVLDYLRIMHAARRSEALRVLFLDARNYLLRDELLLEGSIDEVPLYAREVLRRALELNAAGILVVHNHPSGDPTPSKGDLVSTARLARAAKELGVHLHDHLIFGAEGHSSLRSLGLL